MKQDFQWWDMSKIDCGLIFAFSVVFFPFSILNGRIQEREDYLMDTKEMLGLKKCPFFSSPSQTITKKHLIILGKKMLTENIDQFLCKMQNDCKSFTEKQFDDHVRIVEVLSIMHFNSRGLDRNVLKVND